MDRYGNIWATDAYWNVLWKLNPRGDVLMMLGRRGENGAWNDAAWNGMFNQPLDIAFDQDDNFYVVQGHGGTSPPEDCSFCTTYPYAARPDRRAAARLAQAVRALEPLREFGELGCAPVVAEELRAGANRGEALRDAAAVAVVLQGGDGRDGVPEEAHEGGEEAGQAVLALLRRVAHPRVDDLLRQRDSEVEVRCV